MNKKNSMIQANDSVNSITGQDLSAEMVELSDESLSQVYGGVTWGEILFGLGGYGKPRPTTPPRPGRIPGWHSLSEPSDLEMIASPQSLPTLSVEDNGSLIVL